MSFKNYSRSQVNIRCNKINQICFNLKNTKFTSPWLSTLNNAKLVLKYQDSAQDIFSLMQKITLEGNFCLVKDVIETIENPLDLSNKQIKTFPFYFSNLDVKTYFNNLEISTLSYEDFLNSAILFLVEYIIKNRQEQDFFYLVDYIFYLILLNNDENTAKQVSYVVGTEIISNFELLTIDRFIQNLEKNNRLHDNKFFYKCKTDRFFFIMANLFPSVNIPLELSRSCSDECSNKQNLNVLYFFLLSINFQIFKNYSISFLELTARLQQRKNNILKNFSTFFIIKKLLQSNFYCLTLEDIFFSIDSQFKKLTSKENIQDDKSLITDLYAFIWALFFVFILQFLSGS